MILNVDRSTPEPCSRAVHPTGSVGGGGQRGTGRGRPKGPKGDCGRVQNPLPVFNGGEAVARRVAWEKGLIINMVYNPCTSDAPSLISAFRHVPH